MISNGCTVVLSVEEIAFISALREATRNFTGMKIWRVQLESDKGYRVETGLTPQQMIGATELLIK